MSFKSVLRGFVLWFLIGGVSAPSLAGEPTEQVKATTDKILAIVTDPALKSADRVKERDRLIRQAVDERFDWEEMSKRTLATHWAQRTPEEKRKFVDLFGKLLERTYMERVGDYSGEKVLYAGERAEEDYAVVDVEILTKQGSSVSVSYRLKKVKDRWLVYDISIEGVSLVNNYRTQFHSILVRSSFKELMAKLEAKVDEG